MSYLAKAPKPSFSQTSLFVIFRQSFAKIFQIVMRLYSGIQRFGRCKKCLIYTKRRGTFAKFFAKRAIFVAFKRFFDFLLLAVVSNLLILNLIKQSTARAVLRLVRFTFAELILIVIKQSTARAVLRLVGNNSSHISCDQVVYCESGIETYNQSRLLRPLLLIKQSTARAVLRQMI